MSDDDDGGDGGKKKGNAGNGEQQYTPTYLHAVLDRNGKAYQEEDPHHGDHFELPKTLDKQLETRKFLCYMIITVVIFFIVLYIVRNVMADYLFYANDTGFPGPFIFVFGTLAYMLLITYSSYYLSETSHHPTLVFWSYLTAMIAYVLVAVSISTRTELYVKKVRALGNGALWLSMGVFSTLVLTLVASGVSLGIMLILTVAVSWLLFLIYSWWFRVETRFK
jgi:hypothetical protein